MGNPEKNSGSPSPNYLMPKNPYKHMQRSENQISTGIIKAPIYLKERKKL